MFARTAGLCVTRGDGGGGSINHRFMVVLYLSDVCCGGCCVRAPSSSAPWKVCPLIRGRAQRRALRADARVDAEAHHGVQDRLHRARGRPVHHGTTRGSVGRTQYMPYVMNRFSPPPRACLGFAGSRRRLTARTRMRRLRSWACSRCGEADGGGMWFDVTRVGVLWAECGVADSGGV